jgi:Spy/CpxP family protein refolding chaperone
MNPCRSIALCFLATISLALMPMRASAQAARGGGGGMGGMMALQQMRQVLPDLDLTDDQKSKTDDIMKQTQQDVREKMQGLQDATPEERQAKMQDATKLTADAKEKIVAELTPDQKAKFYPLMAKAGLKQMSDLLAAVKTASAKQDLSDDLRKQLTAALDDAQKTLDGYKSDADGIKDEAGATEFQQKVMKTQMDTRTQLVDILGQEDAQTLMQAARQSMRPGGAGGQGQGQGQRAKRKGAPTTAPDAN